MSVGGFGFVVAARFPTTFYLLIKSCLNVLWQTIVQKNLSVPIFFRYFAFCVGVCFVVENCYNRLIINCK